MIIISFATFFIFFTLWWNTYESIVLPCPSTDSKIISIYNVKFVTNFFLTYRFMRKRKYLSMYVFKCELYLMAVHVESVCEQKRNIWNMNFVTTDVCNQRDISSVHERRKPLCKMWLLWLQLCSKSSGEKTHSNERFLSKCEICDYDCNKKVTWHYDQACFINVGRFEIKCPNFKTHIFVLTRLVCTLAKLT